MTKTVIGYDKRHEQMLKAGKKLLKKNDDSGVTAAAIARACECTAPLVFNHFGNRDKLRTAVREYALRGTVTAKPKAKARVDIVSKPSPTKAKKSPTKAKKSPGVSAKLAPPQAPSNAQ